MIRAFAMVLLGAAALVATVVAAQTGSQRAVHSPLDALRGTTPISTEGLAQPIPQPRNSSERDVRNYPEQPPLIPHAIEGYRIDRNSNKCLSCHARARIGESGAPMLSVTHFMDRDGQILAAVSPRRYFCTQCHISQFEVKAPVPNDFIDADSLLAGVKAGARR